MIKVIQMGLGPIGQQLTQYLSERSGIQITGAVDPDPNKVDKDPGELAGMGKTGIRIVPELSAAMQGSEADVAVISTLSSLQKVQQQIREAADFGLDMVSTCEELIHPFNTQPELADGIHEHCLKNGVSCVGTGVNPGFLMDYLPAVLSSVCRHVRHIRVERYQDARPRRLPFKKKIGAGLNRQEFEAKRNSIRHVGLPESVYLLGAAFNWELDRVEEELKPVVSEKSLELDDITVKEGDIAGVRQVARGFCKGEEVILLDFKAAVGLEESFDAVKIAGEPGFSSKVAGGINGDIATSAIVVNAIRSVMKSEPGLKTMLDIPAPSFFGSI